MVITAVYRVRIPLAYTWYRPTRTAKAQITISMLHSAYLVPGTPFTNRHLLEDLLSYEAFKLVRTQQIRYGPGITIILRNTGAVIV